MTPPMRQLGVLVGEYADNFVAFTDHHPVFVIAATAIAFVAIYAVALVTDAALRRSTRL